jgi:uncharacterized protein
MIPLRRLAARAQWQLKAWQMAVAGAVVSFLTGLIFSTGPLSVPVFTGYGLADGAGVLNASVVTRGLAIGAALLLGSLLARRVVRNVKARHYELLIDGILAVAALSLLVSAL